MGNMMQFFSMGGYAAFVWPAYGIAAIVMLGVLAQSVRSLRAHERELRSLAGTGGEAE